MKILWSALLHRADHNKGCVNILAASSIRKRYAVYCGWSRRWWRAVILYVDAKTGCRCRGRATTRFQLVCSLAGRRARVVCGSVIKEKPTSASSSRPLTHRCCCASCAPRRVRGVSFGRKWAAVDENPIGLSTVELPTVTAPDSQMYGGPFPYKCGVGLISFLGHFPLYSDALITFRASRSRGERYGGHGSLYVCLSLAVTRDLDLRT